MISRAADPQADTPTALKLWVVLARAHRAVADHARRDIERHGLGMTEFAVLEVLHHRGPLPLGAIGERILLTSGSTTYVVDKLEERGFLSRRACDQDRRVVYAELTTAGREVIERIFPAHAEAIRKAMAGLSPAEQRRATELLKRLGLAARKKM
jgi:MarR family 2-MHQ and catechol resistance regulon transcriptional repressor